MRRGYQVGHWVSSAEGEERGEDYLAGILVKMEGVSGSETISEETVGRQASQQLMRRKRETVNEN